MPPSPCPQRSRTARCACEGIPLKGSRICGLHLRLPGSDRFQKKLWVKNGGYLIIDKAEEAEVEGSKITGTIAAVLYAGHIKQLKREPGVWPAEFDNSSQVGCLPRKSRQGDW